MNNRRKWRVAILGLGHWYSAYGLARSLREYPRAELVAAAWDNKAQLDAFSSTFGVTGYGDYDELLEIVGTHGEIIDQWFRAPGRAVLASGASDWIFERHSEEPFIPASLFPLTHLIDCLENNRQPAATIQEARRSLIVALAAYESAGQGRPVRLSW